MEKKRITTDPIYKTLKTLRGDLMYTLAVRDLTSLHLDIEKSIAFLIYIIIDCLGYSVNTDIVLASFGLLRGYNHIPRIDVRRTQISLCVSYDGKIDSLYRVEKTGYKKLAKYIRQFYKNVDSSKVYIKKALNSEYYDKNNKKALLPRSVYKSKLASWDDEIYNFNDPFQLFSINADPKVLKYYNFTESQIFYVDSLLLQIFPPELVDIIVNHPEKIEKLLSENTNNEPSKEE